MKKLEEAVSAASQGDVATTLRALLAAWKENPAPEIAEALERVTTAAKPGGDFAELAEREDVVASAWLVDQLPTMNAAGAAGAISKLGWLRDDPRVAAALLRILASPPWHATGSRPFWTRLFSLLDQNADPRSLALLSKPNRVTTQVNGATMRAWFGTKIDQARDHLEEQVGAPAQTPAAVRKLAASVRLAPTAGDSPRLTQAPKKKGPLNEKALYEAVYANPDDDAPRTVLSDFLIEKGDPRGEFISLQLKRTSTQAEPGREGALLQKHQPAWLGELAGVLRYKNAWVYGPQPYSWGMHVAIRWHRGFLAGANVDFSGPKLKKLAPLPQWATLEYLLGLQLDGKNDADAKVLLGSLRGLNGLTARLPLLRLVPTVAPLAARLRQLNLWLGDDEVPEAMAVVDALPSLRALEVHYTKNAAAVVASKAFERLEELRFFGTVTVRRDQAGVHVALDVTADAFPLWGTALLEALDPKRVKSTSLTGYSTPRSYLAALERFDVEPTVVKKG
ncbi:MAG: TIGR02996 domain-containing protein [Myxococcaceae bacterium]